LKNGINKIKHKFVLLLVIATLLTAFFVCRAHQFYSSTSENVSEVSQSRDISIQLSSDSSDYNIGDYIKFESRITNVGLSTQAFLFNTTCTGGSLQINGRATQVIASCGQVETEVEIKPLETIYYYYEFTLVEGLSSDRTSSLLELEGELDLPPGSHTAKLDWKGFSSGLLTFEVLE
jgi:hypothetical protein